MTRIDSDSLPVGKIPMELLGSMLASIDGNDPDLLVGPGVGKDAAAIAIGDTVLVIKNDPVTFATSDTPVYLVNVNANDLACLGAIPRWMLVTALLPEDKTSAAVVRQMFDQLVACCNRLGITLVGGHTEVTAGVPRPLLIGTLIGTAASETLLTPGGARPGDRLILTRPAGIEGTALLAIERADELRSVFGSKLVESAAALLHDPGISVVDHAFGLIETGAVNALHDPTEGGVLTAFREIGAAAGHGVVINRDLVPLLPATSQIASHFGLDPLGMLSSGTLIAAIDPLQLDIAERHCRETGIPFHVVGKVTSAKSGYRLIEQNKTREIPIFATDEVSRALSQTH